MGVLNAMIWQKGLNSSTGKAAALLVGAVALSVVHVADAASLDAPQALDLITATADRICNVVSTKGEAESSEVKGQVKAQLSGLAAKLADVGSRVLAASIMLSIKMFCAKIWRPLYRVMQAASSKCSMRFRPSSSAQQLHHRSARNHNVAISLVTGYAKVDVSALVE